LQPKPSDVILLEGAKIRQLAGGRSKQDVKRGFAIIESGGITRYFIASNSQEFSRWIQEISEVIDLFESGDEGNTSGRGLDDDAISGVSSLDNDVADLSGHPSEIDGASEDGESENLGRSRRLGNRISGAKTRLGSALENARQKGKDLSERRRDTPSDVLEANTQVSSEEQDGGTKNDDSAASESDTYMSNQAENAAPLDAAEREGSVGGASAGARRRLQLGKALTGMKQVTKNKLGSAIQTARQKGAEATKTPPRPFAGVRGKLRGHSPGPQAVRDEGTGNRSASSSFDREVGESGPSSYWTCGACTFINTVQTIQQSCEICGAKMPVPPNDTTDALVTTENDVGSGESSGVNFSEAAEGFAPNGTDSQPDADSRRARFGAKIGAVVRSVRQNSMDDNNEDSQDARGRGTGTSSRFNFRKRRPGTTSDESLFDDSAMTLKRVHASGSAPSVGASIAPKTPLKLLEGNWVVSVKPQRSPVKQPTKTSFSTNSLPGIESRGEPKSDGSDGALTHSDSQDPVETGPRANMTEAMPELEFSGLFDVRTQRKDSTENQTVVPTVCSLGSLMQLHAAVSESIGGILPQLTHEFKVKPDQEGDPCLLEDSFDMVENVLVTGRMLGGFFDEDISQQNLEKTRGYQGKKCITRRSSLLFRICKTNTWHMLAEIIEWFFNSLLRCPLPVETLMEISDLLGICASTKNVATGESEIAGPTSDGDTGTEKDALQHDIFDSKKAESENLSIERPQQIFGLLSACSTELVRAETSKTRDISTAATPTVLPQVLSSENAPAAMNTTVFEPLLPPSVSNGMQQAMHEALVNVMAERDEAHAQLIASNVLHLHELEQERRKNEKLRIEQELKEAREIERENEAAEKKALKDELRRIKALLAKQETKSEDLAKAAAS
jgi:hypothetical protein